jgi:hypothetical protein
MDRSSLLSAAVPASPAASSDCCVACKFIVDIVAEQESLLTQHYPYDVALSYAFEDRGYADALATILQREGVNFFYDRYEKAIHNDPKNVYGYNVKGRALNFHCRANFPQVAHAKQFVSIW